MRGVNWIKRHRVTAIALLMSAIFIGTTAEGCGGSDQKSPIRSETKSNDDSYAGMVARQPGHSMTYSPTRDTINFWIDKWGKDPNKLSYVYFQNAEGKITGYYIFKGLPVSYCAALKPTWTYEGTPEDGSGALDQRVPAPSADGVYYSGGQCSAYYGRDATTGAYVEYTAGLGINVLLYDQPLPQTNIPALGFTTIADVKK